MGNTSPKEQTNNNCAGDDQRRLYQSISRVNNSDPSFRCNSTSSQKSNRFPNSTNVQKSLLKKKTSWPILQFELCFLPEFPLSSNDNKLFYVQKQIGQGSYGKVYKTINIKTSQQFALKVLTKSKIIRENCINQVKNEVQIQRAVGHYSFIINYLLHWQTKRHLYIVSNYAEGGDFYNFLLKYTILPYEIVQLYIAQIAFALDFLHNAGIIHRDLKLQNLLLDYNGNILLIDFGLSKWLPYGKKTYTICGTDRYMAPEITSKQPYDHAADWWSLGVIACLMLTNTYPSIGFSTSTQPNGEISLDQRVDVPEDLAGSGRDLLLRLLEVDPKRRLRSVRALQTIRFYKDYNFDDVKEKRMKPNDLVHRHFSNVPTNIEEVKHFNDVNNSNFLIDT